MHGCCVRPSKVTAAPDHRGRPKVLGRFRLVRGLAAGGRNSNPRNASAWLMSGRARWEVVPPRGDQSSILPAPVCGPPALPIAGAMAHHAVEPDMRVPSDPDAEAPCSGP